MSDLLKKLDIKEVMNNMQGMVKNVKSMINPNGNIPEPEAGDELGIQIAEISTIAQEVANLQQEQAKALLKMNGLLNDLYKKLEAAKQADAKLAASSDEAVKADESTDVADKAETAEPVVEVKAEKEVF